MEITSYIQGFGRTISRAPGWSMLLISCVLGGVTGCAEYYGPPPAYGAYGAPPPYYAGAGYGYPSYGYGGSVVVDVNDRPYYTHGSSYYVGHAYYVWKPGHWDVRYGRRIWIHGHYVVRGA